MIRTQHEATQEERYLEAFEALRRDGAARDPAWLNELRNEAVSHFSSLGFPTARRGNEEWKYTDVRPIARVPFQTLADGTLASLQREEIDSLALHPVWDRLVFVDGVFSAGLSSLTDLPEGAVVTDLAQAVQGELRDVVWQHLARYADYQNYAFTALNTAFVHHGAFVHLPKGTLVETPLHILYLFTTEARERAFNPRSLVVLESDSRLRLVESYRSLDRESRYLSNAVTELVVGAGASLDYLKLQENSDEAFHITTTQVHQCESSTYSSINVDLGSRLTRNNLNVVMAEQEASCVLNGCYLITASQHVDNQVIIDHAAPYTHSRELYKGVLGGRARSVFHGSIVVREGCVKVDANQVDKNLLLSAEAEADTKPAFWIYCDDVKCGHGAACGQMDERALFYLRSRGLAEEEARTMLTRAFVDEIVQSIPTDEVREPVDGLVASRLRAL